MHVWKNPFDLDLNLRLSDRIDPNGIRTHFAQPKSTRPGFEPATFGFSEFQI